VKAKKKEEQPEFENLGSVITYKKDGETKVVGHLLEFSGRGVFEPNLGKVDIDPKYVEPHNDAFDKALIAGLDERCEVGMHGSFYLIGRKVRTFTGIVVSEDVDLRGSSVTFRRNGRTFRGRLQKDADCFNFRRVA